VISIGTVDQQVKNAFEPQSPGVKRRLEMMRQLSEAGILAGTAMMPAIPIIGDSERQLDDVVSATSHNGGQFVLAGSLTMEGMQAQLTLDAAEQFGDETAKKLRALYHWQKGGTPRYGPSKETVIRLGNTTRELCHKHGIADRIPRYLPTGRYRANKRVAELLFHKAYELELENASQNRIWPYRKAAWTVDELPRGLDELFRSRGEKGLAQLPNISPQMAAVIRAMLEHEAGP
jgi:DNA repair photolyase